MHLVAFTFYSCLAFTLGCIWMCVLFNFKDLSLFFEEDICRNGFCIVWLTCCWEVEQQFHFFTTDIIQLRTLCKLRTCWQIAVFCNLVVSNDIFTPWFFSRSARYR